MGFLTEIPQSCVEAIDYANQVALGEIPACELVQRTVARFFEDVEGAKRGGPFFLDYADADRAIRFAQMMPHIKGPDAGHNIVLSNWQKFIFLNVFGWKRRTTGKRRFKKVYIEVPRGNGKSTMVAPIALYMLSADREQGAEIYSAAVSRDQAKIVFEVAKAMSQRRKTFMAKAGVTTYQNSIAVDSSFSYFKPLSSDSSSLDGLNVHLAILDELARHKRREVHDVIETAMGKRSQPLMVMITTAGPDQGGIGYEVHDYAVKVINKVVTDDSFFGIIYATDVGDDWTQEETWAKANPNWGVSVVPETIGQLASRAIQVPSFQNAFRMKHLNEWTNAAVGFMDPGVWHRQAHPADIQDMVDYECILALDLASKVDIAAAVPIFRLPTKIDLPRAAKWKYHIFPKLYLPEAAIIRVRNTNYAGWAIAGHLIKTPGEVIDFEMLEEDLIEFCNTYKVREVVYDPWQATQLSQRLQARGIPVVEFPATVRNFSEPTKEFEALTRQGLIFHDGNPCMNWMVSNVTVQEDRKGNIFPRKEREENKIDGPVATIMGLARWILNEPKAEESYDLGGMIG